MRRLSVVALIALLGVVTPGLAFAQAQCGGVERWPVKVGADEDAALIDRNPVEITLSELVRHATPTLPARDEHHVRLPEEQTVWQVTARLLKFKPELGKGGDDDYHLIIVDDTLEFSQRSMISSHSFVAEIVKPECVPGRRGDPNTESHFQAELQAVWDKFEQRFPDSRHGWNDAGGMRVRVTGVGFFDRPHGQTGRARNMLELHPVLDIEFLDDAVQPLDVGGTPAAGTNILVNPGFEAGGDGWSVTGESVMSADDNEPALSGQMKAWLGGHGEAGVERISQAISIPSIAASATLTINLHVTTEEQLKQVFDTLDVEITHPNGQVRQTLGRFTNLDAAEGYRIHAFDVTVFRGQNVRLRFTAREDDGSYTSFVLDDLAVIVR